MCSARATSGGGGTATAGVGAVAAAPCCFVGGPGCAALALLTMRPGNVDLELAAAPACWLPGCAAPAELSEFCGCPRSMFTMEAFRCRFVGMPGCAALACASVCGDRVELELAAAPRGWLSAVGSKPARRPWLLLGPGCAALVSSRGRGASCAAAAGSPLPWSAAPSAAEAEPDEAPLRGTLSSRPGRAALTLSKGRLLVHPATAGCSALLAAPASAAGCLALFALGSTLLAAPARAAGCSALLAGAPVWPSRLARSLLPSVMTACCNSVIKVANARRRL